MNAAITTEQALNYLLATNPELVNIDKVNEYLSEVFRNVWVDITKITSKNATFEGTLKQLNEALIEEDTVNGRLINSVAISVRGGKFYFSLSYLPTHADLEEIANF